MAKKWNWIDRNILLLLHDESLASHGGASGIRDEGLLGSALARPINQWNYGKRDLKKLAAAYAFGVARNHPFIDGNKRTAWVLARLFLAINGVTLSFIATDAITMMMALAAGDLDEEAVAAWFTARSNT